jgi:hypothetical protein
MIDVREAGDWTFEVTVEGRRSTIPTVTVDPAFYDRLTERRVPPKALVE